MTERVSSNSLPSRSAFDQLLVRARREITSLLDTLAQRPVQTALLLGALTTAAAAGVGLLSGIPHPAIHDEFSYLLQADTFAAGRLTNPTPPLWEHFETFHVIMQPTYASKYPPGQGILLALGHSLGHPILGVWLSVGLMVAAITWMLFEWLPHRWAVATGVIVAVQIGVASYWAQSYWGGAVAATGGALVFGALRRVIRRPRLTVGLTLGTGFSILALSRPFEGLLVSLPAAGVLVYEWLTCDGYNRLRLGISKAAAAIPTLLTLAFLGFYNWQVTGDPTRFPYRMHEVQYAATPTFLWQDLPSPPHYRHPLIEKYWQTHGVERFERFQEPITFLQLSAVKISKNLLFFLGPGVFVLAFLVRASRDRWILYATLVTGGLFLASLTTMGTYAHYLAPTAGLLYTMLGASLMRLHRSAPRAVAGTRRIVIVMLAFGAFALIGFDPYGRDEQFANRRAELTEWLSNQRGSDLVIVQYGSDHSVHEEWIYNQAILDSAEVIWARGMGHSKNRRLIHSFPNRNAWLLEVDAGHVELSRYAYSWVQPEGN